MLSNSREREAGQALPLFAFSLVVILLCLGLAVDAGYAYSQNRNAQNASDFASIAGTRIVGEYNVGNTANGTALQVYNAIQSELTAHNATYSSAFFTTAAGAAIAGDIKAVGTAPDGGNYGTIPPGAVGVVVVANHTWRPFFLAAVGMSSWTASTTSTAITAGQSIGGGVLPVGICGSSTCGTSNYGTLTSCPVTALTSCIGSNLTPSTQNLPPGSFAWLAFGANGSCPGSQLGMDTTRGCGTSQGFLDGQVGPPSDSYGCCTSISTSNPSGDIIGIVPGNKWSDLSYYISNQIAVWVPIYDTVGSQGSNGYVHIVGFAPIVFVGEDTQHGKWLTGAAVSGVGCPGTGNTQVSGYSYTLCSSPGGAITLGATGGVRLVH